MHKCYTNVTQRIWIGQNLSVDQNYPPPVSFRNYLIKLGKIYQFNRSNYKFVLKKVFLLKKNQFYISKIIASIVATLVMCRNMRQVVATTCRNVATIASRQNGCGRHPCKKPAKKQNLY